MTSLNWQAVLKHAGIVGLAAILTYCSQIVVNYNFGEWTPFIILVLSTAIHALVQYLTPPPTSGTTSTTTPITSA